MLLIFPLAIFDSVKNIENDVWILVLHLREIYSLICASALSISQIVLLQEKTNEYLLLRITCFPSIKLRPKHHYISHYPSLTLSFGPLKHLWMLRFESKHRYFKNIVKHSQNFKNIIKLLSHKHQFLQSQYFKNRYYTLAIADNAQEYISENFNNDQISFITDYFHNKQNENVKYISSKVIFRGITYKKICICIGKDCYDHFIICKIKYILINECYTNIYFLGSTTTIIYNPDFGVYEQLEIKDQHYNVEKIYLFPCTICFHTLVSLHHILFLKLI